MPKVNQINIKMFFKDHYHPLCLYATHFVGDAAKAEDVVMECFVSFVGKVDSGWLPNDAKGYIYAMVKNACRDEMKHTMYADSIEEIRDFADDDDDVMEECEREARLWKAINELPEACRRVFLMCKRDGMKYKEVAETLGLSVKTVETQMRKAFSLLRSKADSIYSNIQNKTL